LDASSKRRNFGATRRGENEKNLRPKLLEIRNEKNPGELGGNAAPVQLHPAYFDHILVFFLLPVGQSISAQNEAGKFDV
jgi:hypothetical protein